MDKLLTLQQVAQRLAISKTTAYCMAATGELPALRFRTVWRVDSSRLEEWIREHTREGKGGA